MYILTSYFGGADLISNCVYNFFFTNYGKSEPLHSDFSSSEGKSIIGQIFYQAIDVVEFGHNQGYIYKNINDENILIRRREGSEEQGYNIPYIFEIALCDCCDWQVQGMVSKGQFPYDTVEKFVDGQNIELYPKACDIYALGELLHKLIMLYHYFWDRDIKVTWEKYSEIYKEEIQLVRIMKTSILERPKSIKELKESA